MCRTITVSGGACRAGFTMVQTDPSTRSRRVSDSGAMPRAPPDRPGRGGRVTALGVVHDDHRPFLLRSRDAILDGEILAVDSEGRADFHLLMRSQGSLHFAAFDLLWANGQDLRGLPLVIRKRRLEKLIPEPTPALSRVLTVEKDGLALFEAAQRLDLDGIVAKWKADTYEAGATWYKIKNKAYTQDGGPGRAVPPIALEAGERRRAPGIIQPGWGRAR